MKKIFSIVLFIFLMMSGNCYAAKYNFLIIPTDMLIDEPHYLVYPKAATLIATELATYYNQHPEMSAISLNQLLGYLKSKDNYRFRKQFIKFINDYQSNYTIDYPVLQKIAARFRTNKILLISCNIDTQNYITRRTLWDALNIPGATVVDPAYRLSTQVTLVDANNQVVLWEHNYQKLLSSRENRIIPTSFNQAQEQTEKIKKYSNKFLAPQIIQETQLVVKNMSPYQNLDLHPEIVKPDYVSIDKIKLDTKRGAVKSRRALARWGRSRKADYRRYKKERNDYNALPTDDKIEVMQKKYDLKYEKQQEQQLLKYEKAKQKQELNAAKKQMQLENKYELQKLKYELQTDIRERQYDLENDNFEHRLKVQEEHYTKMQPIEETRQELINKQKATVESQKATTESKKQAQRDTANNNKKEKEKSKKQKPAKQQEENINVNNKQIEVVPSSTIMQQEMKPVPYIRTKPVIRDYDYTINDY